MLDVFIVFEVVLLFHYCVNTEQMEMFESKLYV